MEESGDITLFVDSSCKAPQAVNLGRDFLFFTGCNYHQKDDGQDATDHSADNTSNNDFHLIFLSR